MAKRAKKGEGKKYRDLCWIAIDRWGMSASALWRIRRHLKMWLQRKYPASWWTYRIARVRVVEVKPTNRKGK